MSKPHGIAWLNMPGYKGESWNPITGCTPVSEGCANCYAMAMAKRLQAMGSPNYKNGFDVAFHPEVLNKVAHWKKPRFVFVCSMSDLFHKDVHPLWISDILQVIKDNPQHIFIVLTKRSEIMRGYFSAIAVPSNLWLGVSVENEERAYERIPILMETPAALRVVSVEPMLGPVDIVGRWMVDGLDWVIVGCESGPKRRPCKIEWVESIVEQCRYAHVPCFVKQLDLGGKVSHNMNEWPESLRVQQWPEMR